MKNFISKGYSVGIASAVSYLSGEVVLEGDLAGVAVADAADGEVVAHLEGVFELPISEAFVVGELGYVAAAQGSLSKTPGKLVGVCVEAGASGTAKFKLK